MDPAAARDHRRASRPGGAGRAAPLSEEELPRSLCDQAAVAVERTMLVSDLQEARLVSETEQLRSALLSSVSHDLRTPLAGMIGSVTSLLEYGASFSDENRRELLQTVLEESEHLNRHIQNLLDMTRLGLAICRRFIGAHGGEVGAFSGPQGCGTLMRITIPVSPVGQAMDAHG